MPPRRRKLILPLSDEYSEVLARCEANRAEVLAQERAALSTLPAIKEALEAYDAAVADAERQYEETVTASQQTLATAESDAVTEQTDLETQAIQALQQAIDDGDVTRRDALDAVREEYDRAYRDATTAVGPERDAKLAEARSARSGSIATAEREYRAARRAAQSAHQKSMNDAREGAITAIEKARRTQQRAADGASLERDRAREKAEKAWRDAVASEPLAPSIREAFQLRMQEVEVDCEREKNQVLKKIEQARASSET
jgi:hypothetical protein